MNATNWKQLLIKVRELVGEAGVAVYDRATLLSQVFGDLAFVADCNEDQGKAADRLDEYTNDLCLTFLELRQLLKHFPKRAQWKSGKIRRMYDEMVQAIVVNQTRRAPALRSDVDSNSVGRPQGGEQAGSPQVPIATEQSELDRLRSLVKTLQKENRDLRRTLTKLRNTLEPAFV